VSGGMESMSNAPYLLAKARSGYRAGHDRIIDHMMMDGLEDAYETGRSMGDFGEATAEAYQFTRKDQDAYAIETLTRARKAVEGGAFKAEIVPITLTEKAGPRIIANDEHPLKVDPAKIPGLKAAFRANGTITPAASSANADGAAALILTKRSLADRDSLPTLAEIKGHATHSQEPQWFTTAPIPAIRKLLDKVGWSVGDVDLFEINEAFAVVAMAAQRDLGIPREKLNTKGRACRNIHYGWAMVGVTFLSALISAGTVGAPGVFIVPLQNEFRWTTAEISSALSIRFILFGLMAPFAAALLNRYGLRNVTLSALLVVVSGLVTSLAMTKIWHLMLLWGVVTGIGTGMTALVLGATIAARWFVARRGLVV